MPRMRLLAIWLLTCAAAALCAARPAVAQPYLAGGKHTLAAWHDVPIVAGTGSLELSVPFKGKKNAFVIVQTAAQSNPACPLQTVVSLNGEAPFGLGDAQSGDCAGQPCMVSSSSAFDLDALEAATPDQFIGKQLTVRVQVSVGGSCTFAKTKFIAQLVKK